MIDLISRKAVTDLMWKLLISSEYDGDKIIATIDDIKKLAGLEHTEMNCIKDGKYTGESCLGCSIKIKDCEIRDKVYRSRWIPASERLPEIRLHKGEPIEFITMVKGEQAPRTLYIDREDSWRHVDSYYDPYDDYKYNVIAWQPLPEPYKEG